MARAVDLVERLDGRGDQEEHDHHGHRHPPETSADRIGPFAQQEEERGDQEQEQPAVEGDTGARPRRSSPARSARSGRRARPIVASPRARGSPGGTGRAPAGRSRAGPRGVTIPTGLEKTLTNCQKTCSTSASDRGGRGRNAKSHQVHMNRLSPSSRLDTTKHAAKLEPQAPPRTDQRGEPPPSPFRRRAGRQPEPRPREHEHRGERGPRRRDPEARGHGQSARGQLLLLEVPGEQEAAERDHQVAHVLLELGGVVDQIVRDGRQRQHERHRSRRDRAAGDGIEQRTTTRSRRPAGRTSAHEARHPGPATRPAPRPGSPAARADRGPTADRTRRSAGRSRSRRDTSHRARGADYWRNRPVGG